MPRRPCERTILLHYSVAESHKPNGSVWSTEVFAEFLRSSCEVLQAAENRVVEGGPRGEMASTAFVSGWSRRVSAEIRLSSTKAGV